MNYHGDTYDEFIDEFECDEETVLHNLTVYLSYDENIDEWVPYSINCEEGTFDFDDGSEMWQKFAISYVAPEIDLDDGEY